jgi:hypothetical protein
MVAPGCYFWYNELKGAGQLFEGQKKGFIQCGLKTGTRSLFAARYIFVGDEIHGSLIIHTPAITTNT